MSSPRLVGDPSVSQGTPIPGEVEIRQPIKGVQWLHRATSPLLRSDFAQSTAGRMPNGDLTDQFRPSDGRAVPTRAVPHRDRCCVLGKVTDMRTPLARLWSVIRGDKYMVDAYSEPADIAGAADADRADPATPAASPPKEG